MAPSPPLSLGHPDYYITETGLDDTPAMAAAEAESYTGIATSSADAASKTPGVKPEKKRRRPALSCEQCRRRKIRCDRGLPCVNCVKSKISPCTYAPTHVPASRAKKAVGHGQEAGSDRMSHVPIRSAPIGAPESNSKMASPSEHLGPAISFPRYPASSVPGSTVGSTSETSTVDALVARVRQLEERLANNVHISRPGDDRIVEPTEEEESRPMKGTVSKTRFFGQSHWMNGAENFPAILSILGKAEAQRIEPYSTFLKCKALGRTIKENRLKPLATNTLGQTVPGRDLADQLVDAYFDSFEGGIRILHVPTFRVEYERYWQNPSVASDVFVMQLQLCMAIGATVHDDLFTLRSQAVQWVHEAQLWLLLPPEKSRMTIAGIQILCMLAIAKATCAVGQDLTWVTTGGLIRQAMYMGLHRDPRHLANMSVYRAEMRRRLWATILELNLESSYDAGGPPLISAKHYDTELPANLNDDQLTDEPDKYPSSVNDPNALTDMSVQMALLKSLPLRLTIIKHINEFRTKESYPETLRLNSDLTKACRTMTETLASLSRAQQQISRIIITQFHGSLVQLFLYRCFISLHQPMLTRAADDPIFYYSRKVALDCSIKMAQICGLSTPRFTPTPPGPTSPTLTFNRLITNGAGVFRVVPTQSLFAIALELITKKEEQRESLGSLPSMGSSDLRLVLDAALEWTERRIRSGETNIKGHCFTAACIALADAIEMDFSKEDTDQAVINTGASISIKCWDLLREVAEREGVPANEETDSAVEMEGVESMGSFMDMPFNWMGFGDIGWDTMGGVGGMGWGRNTGISGMPKEYEDMTALPHPITGPQF
ncbi:Fc.00g085460.m01.CDS01 [Cosmosporella sp. VM-42]